MITIRWMRPAITSSIVNEWGCGAARQQILESRCSWAAVCEQTPLAKLQLLKVHSSCTVAPPRRRGPRPPPRKATALTPGLTIRFFKDDSSNSRLSVSLESRNKPYEHLTCARFRVLKPSSPAGDSDCSSHIAEPQRRLGRLYTLPGLYSHSQQTRKGNLPKGHPQCKV